MRFLTSLIPSYTVSFLMCFVASFIPSFMMSFVAGDPCEETRYRARL
jgi:predicted membrane metal-binding protein